MLPVPNMKCEKGDFLLFCFPVPKLPPISYLFKGGRHQLPLIFNRKTWKQMTSYKEHV